MALPDDRTRNVLDRLKRVKRSGAGWSALCPAHEDRSASLTVGIGAEDKILLNCHAGCTTPEIVGALGLLMSDLFKESPKEKKDSLESVYDYHDKDGTLIFQVVKKRLADGRKDFRQRRPDGGGGWVWSATGIEKPLFRLPQLLQAIREGSPVWIVEGEKDVMTLYERGITATTNAGGAGKWSEEYARIFKGATVTVCVDNDTPGYKHGLYVAETVGAFAEHIRVVAPPKEVNDLTDAVEKLRMSPTEFTKINLEEVLELHDPFRDLIGEIRAVGNQEHLELPQKINRVRSILDRAEVTEKIDQFGRLVRWDNFLSEPNEGYDWVIPQLIERGERTILVGGEGSGKTMLMRQMGIMLAMGIHPFHKTKMEPITTFTIDLENPEKIIRRTSKKIWDAARVIQPYQTKMNAHLLVKPDGVDLLKPADRLEIENLVAMTEPDILFIGPIYKAYNDPGNKTAGVVVTEVVKYLDYIRDTYQCALFLEHHAPLGGETNRVLRPVDSGVWTRWPEFGIALQPDPTAPEVFDLKHFRGGRDVRDWPKKLVRGHEFPWAAEY